MIQYLIRIGVACEGQSVMCMHIFWFRPPYPQSLCVPPLMSRNEGRSILCTRLPTLAEGGRPSVPGSTPISTRGI